jgi:hypothetical protein
MTERMANVRPLDHFKRGDAVARAFGELTGRTQGSAHVWLQKPHNREVATALRAHRLAGAWARRESWAAEIVAELHQLPDRRLNDDLLLDHLAADQNDDHWRVAYLNHRDTESRKQWCKALSRFHALNLSVMNALKREA